ncbi:hypothetical protein HC928_15755, partial [bacterium]|nr:hypothetical protein [bacterium]
MSDRPPHQRKTLQSEEGPPSFGERLILDMLGMPRLARIFVVVFFALAVTLAVSPIIDSIYLSYFFDERTVIVPSLVAAAFGVVMYAAGWILVVGWQGGGYRPRRSVLAYIVIGLLAVAAVVGWLLTT